LFFLGGGLVKRQGWTKKALLPGGSTNRHLQASEGGHTGSRQPNRKKTKGASLRETKTFKNVRKKTTTPRLRRTMGDSVFTKNSSGTTEKGGFRQAEKSKRSGRGGGGKRQRNMFGGGGKKKGGGGPNRSKKERKTLFGGWGGEPGGGGKKQREDLPARDKIQ